jgi:hypothetical protein
MRPPDRASRNGDFNGAGLTDSPRLDTGLVEDCMRDTMFLIKYTMAGTCWSAQRNNMLAGTLQENWGGW